VGFGEKISPAGMNSKNIPLFVFNKSPLKNPLIG
jgi:hypothetical protein